MRHGIRVRAASNAILEGPRRILIFFLHGYFSAVRIEIGGIKEMENEWKALVEMW